MQQMATTDWARRNQIGDQSAQRRNLVRASRSIFSMAACWNMLSRWRRTTALAPPNCTTGAILSIRSRGSYCSLSSKRLETLACATLC